MGPRFLSLAPSIVRAWSDRLVVPRPPDPPPSWDDIGWRLVGISNRELGRGVLVARPAVVAARTADLVIRADEVSVVVVPADHATWTWHATLGDVVVAASPRAYRRRREAELRGSRFCEVLPLAQPLLATRLLESPGEVTA